VALDVAVIGAGPTGLMLANLLGQHGLRVSVFEAGSELVDFPRGVGMDDETCRTFQAAGLVDAVLPHTIPHQRSEPTPVGRLFIQPTVSTRQAPSVKLDDALGPWFALIAWNNDPYAILDDDARQRLARAGVRLVAARPGVQLGWEEAAPDDRVLIVGDLDGALKRWFDTHAESVVLLRPDRIVGGASPAYAASDMVRGFDLALGATAEAVVAP
jgi:2-polyprenyl-6-methoxyphenol hydroxylase-like FAD-dependent oxidoreductase